MGLKISSQSYFPYSYRTNNFTKPGKALAGILLTSELLADGREWPSVYFWIVLHQLSLKGASPMLRGSSWPSPKYLQLLLITSLVLGAQNEPKLSAPSLSYSFLVLPLYLHRNLLFFSSDEEGRDALVTVISWEYAQWKMSFAARTPSPIYA